MARIPLASPSVLLLAAAIFPGCGDNVGVLFDPERGAPTGGTGVTAMVVGGDAVEGRPRVLSVFPEGAGWPETVPIVVVFNETLNADSVVPATTPGGGSGAPTAPTPTVPRLRVRPAGSENSVAANYDFLFGDQVVLIRPLAPLTAPTGGGGTGAPPPVAEFEIVIDPALSDADGVTFGGREEVVLATFSVDDEVSEADDGGVLTVLPVDRARSRPREVPIYAIFTKPADEATVTSTTFRVQDAGGNLIAADDPSFPLTVGALEDTRIARLDPQGVLPGDAQLTVVLDAAIAFGGGEGNLPATERTTFATLGAVAPTSVAVGNAPAGFPDKINRGNLETLLIDVGVDASAAAGDSVTVRIYGLDARTQQQGDLTFVERSAQLGASGLQTVTVDFTGRLGTVAAPLFEDGELTLAGQVTRGGGRTGYVLSRRSNQPELDLTLPTLLQAGPPSGTGTFDLLTDLQHVAFYGRADEELGAAMLTAGSVTVGMFGSDASGGFAMAPLDLLLRTTPLTYQLTVTDTAGNVAAAAASGTIVPRGVVTGTASGGTLVVEAFDASSLRAISGATVLIEPGLPAKPAIGRLTATTGADGRAVFSGLTQPRHTITVIATGYDLKTLLDTGAGFASLALRPLAGATAAFSGTAVFDVSAGASALIGHNLLDDPVQEGVLTQVSAPTTIPSTPIRPSRPQVITAFGGAFEPVTVPAFQFQGCPMTGPLGNQATAPGVPAAPGGATTQGVALIAVGLTTRNLAAPVQIDFNAAGGLDTANLVGNPTVRILASLVGFPGMALFGAGLTNRVTGATFAGIGTYSVTMPLVLAGFGPVLFASLQAIDSAGNVSRHRSLIDIPTGIAFPLLGPPGIPTIAPPGAPSAGSPVVTYQDRLDPAALAGAFGFVELTATDSAARRWTVLRQDTDAAVGPVAIQFPDLAGTGLFGLASGSWSVRAETHLLASAVFAPDHYVFEEMRRQQIGYARAAPVAFTVN